MTPDVLVVGAGVIGASVAWHLRARGARVTLIDGAAGPGAGSTGRATGGFRAQYGSEINVRLSLLARDQLRRFAEDTGVDPGYRPVGYLWLAGSRAQLDALAAANALQRAAGLVEARLLAPGDIAAVNPLVDLDGVLGAAFCPSDGFLRPLAILEGYLAGAEVRWGEPAVAVERAGDRIVSVRTPRARIAAGAFVNAAGAWAAEVARLAGVDLPVSPLVRRVAATVPTAAVSPDLPMTLWTADGFHLRERDGRVLLLLPGDGLDDDDWFPAVARIAAARVPVLAGVAIDRAASWHGLYEMSPDKHALLGAAPGCANLYLANGSSGHGVMHAPALGQLLSEIIVDGAARTIDTTSLRPSRFAEGAPNATSDVL